MVLVADLPQVWGMRELAQHYPGWSAQRIKDELAARVNLKFKRGQRIACDLTDVRAIDAQLERDAAARRCPRLQFHTHVFSRGSSLAEDLADELGQRFPLPPVKSPAEHSAASVRELIAGVLTCGGPTRSRRDTTAVKKGTR